MRFDGIRQGSHRYRLALEAYRLGQLTFDEDTGLWRYGGFTARRPGDLIDGKGRTLLQKYMAMWRYLSGHKDSSLAMVQALEILEHQIHDVYRHVYFIGTHEPDPTMFEPVINGKIHRYQPYGTLVEKPEGGLWLSPWSAYAPEWGEWMFDQEFRAATWKHSQVWELEIDDLKVVRATDTSREPPDFMALAEEYDLFHMPCPVKVGTYWEWSPTWDVTSYVLLRWPENPHWNKIASSLERLLREGRG